MARTNPFSDVYRVGRLNYNQVSDRILRVLEIDIAALDLSDENSHGIVPDGAPPIDGVVVCYDSSEESSFDPVETVLRKCPLVQSSWPLVHGKQILSRT